MKTEKIIPNPITLILFFIVIVFLFETRMDTISQKYDNDLLISQNKIAELEAELNTVPKYNITNKIMILDNSIVRLSDNIDGEFFNINNKINELDFAIKNLKNKSRNDIQYYNQNNKELFKEIENNDIKMYKMQGYSMSPTITEGDYMLCDYSINEYKAGMIATYKNQLEKKMITHRIKICYDDFCIFQGDNNLKEDERVYKEDIKCVVISTIY